MRWAPLLLAAAITGMTSAASGQGLVSSPASSQTPGALSVPAPAAGILTAGEFSAAVEFGVRATSVSGDAARFQRLRDERSGPTIDRARYVRDTGAWNFSASASRVGYRDQRYVAGIERYGKLKASFEWNQIPLFISADTRTPYTETEPGVFRLDDDLQRAVQAGTGTIGDFLRDVRPFAVRSRRDVADLRVSYSATRELDLRLALTSTRREGTQPGGAPFGQNLSVELPVPIDHRTNDMNATAEWSNARGMARIAYDGSWFTNHVGTLVFDNPLRATDRVSTGVDGPSQGRMALSPDSTAHAVSAAASLVLPARTRAFGSVSVGSWLQDAQLLPYTINTAITPIPLARSSAEAEARIVSANLRLTSRPTPTLWLNGQYRLYDYDNRTPHFAVDQYARVDGTTAVSATGGSEPFGYTRHFADLDASYTPFRFVAFRAGYGVERDHRTFRFLEETTEHSVRGSIDSTAFAWGSVRLQYDHAVRTGNGFDEEAFSEIGEQVSLRQFDISDRTRDRASAIVQVVPVDAVGLNASVSVGQDHRPGAAFGLQDNNLRAVTVGIDVNPGDMLLVGASYAFENYSTLQRSRQANPGVQFDDPTRDWSTDMDEKVHTFGGNLELPRLTSRSSLRVGYDAVRSNALYQYLLPANSTLVTPRPLAPVVNRMQRASVELRHALTGRAALVAGYSYDSYDVEDFALSPGTMNSPVFSTFINLMYQFRPYDAHTGYLRLAYTW